MKANIGISEEHLQEIATVLNKLLSDEIVLQAKTRAYHWNVEGSNFMEMHHFYEEQYKELSEMIDEVAERVRQLGHYAEGRLQDYLRLTRLDEPAPTNNQKEQIKNLLLDHESIIINLRRDIIVAEEKNDAGTADFLTGMMEHHEKMAWMLRAYLK